MSGGKTRIKRGREGVVKCEWGRIGVGCGDWGGVRGEVRGTYPHTTTTLLASAPQPPLTNHHPHRVNKQKASFGLSGALAKDEVTGKVVNGVTLKYNPPADRILPSVQWRFFVFKGDEVLDTLFVHRKDNFLLGSNDKVCDILMEHGSISGQHAVLQYRRVPYSGKKEKFMGSMVCKPYLMDLDSTNGTILNKEKIDGRRYYELRKGDVISFGESTREYVFMVEKSKKK